MSVSAVDMALSKVRMVVREWDEAELSYCREDHTRYGVIDAIIRALGWDTSGPKERRPEYPRSYESGRRVDYALFGTPDVEAFGGNSVQPDVVVEPKALREPFDDDVPQLQRYVEAAPRIS